MGLPIDRCTVDADAIAIGSCRSCAQYVSHQHQSTNNMTRFVTMSDVLVFCLMVGASHHYCGKHWTNLDSGASDMQSTPWKPSLNVLFTSQLPSPLRQKFQAHLLICNQGVSQMICPCDLRRLLLQNLALRTFARGCASRSVRQGHNPFCREAECSFPTKRFPSTFQGSQQICRSKTLCTMTEAVQAPPAENGAVDAEVVALRKQIADLQVSTSHILDFLEEAYIVSNLS